MIARCRPAIRTDRILSELSPMVKVSQRESGGVENWQKESDGHPIIGHYVIWQRARHQTTMSRAMRVLHNGDYRTPRVNYFPPDVYASPVPNEPRSLLRKLVRLSAI